jgi:Epoxide hydrolase N terminus
MSVTIADPAGGTAIRPFTIPEVPQAEVEALRARIAATRWPDQETVTDDSQGVPRAMLQELARHWAGSLITGTAGASRPRRSPRPCPATPATGIPRATSPETMSWTTSRCTG